jgi:ankyrin repeat protein
MTIVVNVHVQSDFASSPLGKACRNNQLQVVKTLIENGAMVNYRNKVCFDSIIVYISLVDVNAIKM